MRQELKQELGGKKELRRGREHGRFLLTGVLNYFSYIAPAHLPKNGIVYSELGCPTSISNVYTDTYTCTHTYIYTYVCNISEK